MNCNKITILMLKQKPKKLHLISCLYGKLMQAFVLIITEENPFKPEREPTGFFPPINKASRPATAAEEPLMPAYQSATTSGFVPNSVLVKILWPPPPPQPEKSQESWRPPSLSDGQLEEIEKEKVFTNF